MDRQSEISSIKSAIHAYASGDNPSKWYNGDPFSRLVELDPEEAAREAQRWQDTRDSELCELYHLPASMMTRDYMEQLRDYADGCTSARDNLVHAGARTPVHVPCHHEKRGGSPVPQR